MHLPEQIINEIITAARAGRPQRQQDLPSPRGVAELQFNESDGGDAEGSWRTARIFPKGQTAKSVANTLASCFFRELLENIAILVEHTCSLTIKAKDVRKALDTFMAQEAQLKCYDDVDACTMDVDDSSDYAGSEMEDEEESVAELETFDDMYPPAESSLSDQQFKDQVVVPFMEHYRRSFLSISATIAGMLKNAVYAYVAAKLSDLMSVLDQLEEANCLLELAVWKSVIEKSVAATHEERKQCRVKCGADIVAKNVLPFLFAGVGDES